MIRRLISGLHPGDDLIPDANLVFDRLATLPGRPEAVWPWLVQLGKARAGWYLPGRVERLLPPSRRATRELDGRWQSLAVGDRIPDYGGREEYLEVAVIDPPSTLVYRSERRGTPFTWALLLESPQPDATRLRLRFRGRLRSTGWRRRVIVGAGDFFDFSTTELMAAGLRERLRVSSPPQSGARR